MAKKSQSNPEWAVEVWSVLVRKAHEQKEINYSDVSIEVGHGSAQIGDILEYIQEYCKQKGLPKLTVIVVKKGIGVPGSGMDPHTEVDYREVYGFDWQKLAVPTVAEFEKALEISKGRKPPLKFQKIRSQIAPFSRQKDNGSD